MKHLLLLSFLMITCSGIAQSATGYFDKAMKKAEAGNTKGAIADYTKAISMNSKFVEAYQNRGVAKYKLNDLTGALADFTKAIELDTMNSDAFTGRANVNYKLMNYDASIEDCSYCLMMNPKDYIAYNLRGLAYNKIGEKKKSCSDFTKAIELGSKSAIKNKATFCK
ncbi:tetratricopeptide repeat protein [Flavobacterium sp. LC2016-23]|uniref:tetratricopeptide repeat protein n=1 Tax=Flavobacterium sp. LC2016-23 TaxID=2666330 RepID=UPI001E2DFE3D|nr:tetratricopeptide repeat protein [Flavobacterium sp. LC2016-23]